MLIRLGICSVLISAAIYLFICVVLYFAQDKLIFPSYLVADASYKPNIKISTAQGSTQVLIKDKHSNCDVLYFGGNAEAVDASLVGLEKAFEKCNLLLMVYRGYGLSDGTPNQQTLYADALALYQLRNKSPNKNFIIVGRSLGASVATFVASQVRVDQLVLVTPFDSLSHLAAQKYPWLPTSILLKNSFPSDAYARLVSAPVHIIMAQMDEIIPARNTTALLNAFTQRPVKLTRLEKVGHNTVDEHPGYLAALAKRF
ncbi:MAG TPA: alpha/beta hydrolase [Cellvibrionaceae bacterium]